MMVFIGKDASCSLGCRSCPELCQELRGFLFGPPTVQGRGARIARRSFVVRPTGCETVYDDSPACKAARPLCARHERRSNPVPLASLALWLCCAPSVLGPTGLRYGATFAARGGRGFLRTLGSTLKETASSEGERG
jgi:hypothetical protein